MTGDAARPRRAPRVSVLLPVHDGRAFLREAIDSILGQTFRDFELLVIDDGSTDGSAAIAAEYRDPRLRLVANGENLGLIRTLNRGLELARGDYVARMDADDVSLPERIARQVDFLDANPDVGICGSWTYWFGEVRDAVKTYPTRPEDVRCQLLFDGAIAHPSVCLRRGWFARHGLRFDEAYPYAEDYELWCRASEIFPLANLDEVLLRHRVHARSVTRRHARAQEETVRRIQREALVRLGVHPSEQDLLLHRAVSGSRRCEEMPPLPRMEAWLLELLRANARQGTHPAAAFERAVGGRWLAAARRAVAAGWTDALPVFLRSPLCRYVDLADRLRLLLQAAKRTLSG